MLVPLVVRVEGDRLPVTASVEDTLPGGDSSKIPLTKTGFLGGGETIPPTHTCPSCAKSSHLAEKPPHPSLSSRHVSGGGGQSCRTGTTSSSGQSLEKSRFTVFPVMIPQREDIRKVFGSSPVDLYCYQFIWEGIKEAMDGLIGKTLRRN